MRGGAPARPRPPAFGPVAAISGPEAARPSPQAGIASSTTAKASIRRTISPNTASGYVSMAVQSSMASIAQVISAKSSEWRKFVEVHRAQGSAIAGEAIMRIAKFYVIK